MKKLLSLLVLAAGAIVVVASLPDIKRYFDIRRM